MYFKLVSQGFYGVVKVWKSFGILLGTKNEYHGFVQKVWNFATVSAQSHSLPWFQKYKEIECQWCLEENVTEGQLAYRVVFACAHSRK